MQASRVFLLGTVLVAASQATTLSLDSLIGTQTLATVTLDASKPVTVCDNNQPTQCWGPYLMPGAAGHTVTFWVTYINAASVSLANGSPTPCHDPCQLNAFRNVGDLYFGAKDNTSSVILQGSIPTVGMQPLGPSSWKFPREVIGQDNFVDRIEITIPGGSPTTGCLLYERLNNHSYQAMAAGQSTGGKHAPWDGKMSVRIWSGTTIDTAGAWINLNNTTTTAIDGYGISAGIDGVHSIASVVGTIEITAPIPDHSFAANSTIVLEHRFNGSDGITSGYRVLDARIVCGSAVQLSQIAVASNVATATAMSGTNPFANGSDVLVYGAPGIRGRFNGPRHITATTSSTFSFTPCGSGAGFYALSCTSPNGTYSVPTSSANTNLLADYPGTAQQAMYAIAIVAPTIAGVSFDDPTTYTAPGGGNATTGHTLFTTRNSLLVSNGPDSGYKITASCADCHAGNATLTGGMKQEGSDIAYFNYSNNSIEQRAMFHGLTWQNALDIAAYIRSIPASAGGTINVYANARPFNPPFQPCPGLDSNPVDQWPAGGGVECILSYDADAKEYMEPAGSTASWAYNTVFDYRQTPSQFQLADWNHWLPPVHPADAYPSISFFTSSPYTGCSQCYTEEVTALAANTTMAYSSQATNLATNNPLITTGAGILFGLPDCIPNISWTKGSCVPPSEGAVRKASVYRWYNVKMQFELMHPTYEGMCDTFYTTLYGARPMGSYNPRCWYTGGRGVFNGGDHIVFGGIMGVPNTQGANAAAFPTVNIGYSGRTQNNQSFQLETNGWYSGSVFINFGNYIAHAGDVVDSVYYPGFLNAESQIRPCVWECFVRASIMFNQASQDTTPYNLTGGIQASVLYNLSLEIAGAGAAPSWAWTSSSDQTALLTWKVQAINTLLGLFSTATWNTNSGFSTPDPAPDPGNCWLGGSNNPQPCVALLLAIAKYFSVSVSTLNTLASTATNTLPTGSGAGVGGTHNYADDVFANCGLNRYGGGDMNLQRDASYWPFCSHMGGYGWTVQTTLNGNITCTDLSCTGPVASCTGISANSSVLIGTEQIGVASCSAGAITFGKRGLQGTTAATHSNGANVSN